MVFHGSQMKYSFLCQILKKIECRRLQLCLALLGLKHMKCWNWNSFSISCITVSFFQTMYYLAALVLLTLPGHAAAYSTAVCTDACQNLRDPSKYSLCQSCVQHVPLEYKMCLNGCGCVQPCSETSNHYNPWFDYICIKCFSRKPFQMATMCNYVCHHMTSEQNKRVCVQCLYRRQKVTVLEWVSWAATAFCVHKQRMCYLKLLTVIFRVREYIMNNQQCWIDLKNM